MMIDLAQLWHELETAVRQTLATNELAQGGLLIAAFSAIAVYARTLPASIWNKLKDRLTVTLDIQGDDNAFPWVAAWLAAQPNGRHLRHLGVVTKYNERMGGQNLTLGQDEEGDDVNVRLVPLGGQILLNFRGHWMLARPDREKETGANQNLIGYRHSLTFRMLTLSRHLIPQLLQEAYEFTEGKTSGQVEIHIPQHDDWRQVEERPARPLSSLIYDGDLLTKLKDDLHNFYKDRDWYADMGIPYRRGYLLHGPPGNGKSSLVAALAGEFNMNVCVLNLATPDLTDERLNNLLSDLPRRALLLLEDIDAVFIGREPRTNTTRLSFNGLLNALDGVAASEGRVTFMTTNDLSALDAALIRPGRADQHLLIGNATQFQVAGMLHRFWPDWTELQVNALTNQVPDGLLSMAKLQEYLLERRTDEQAVKRDWNTLLDQKGETHVALIAGEFFTPDGVLKTEDEEQTTV